MAKQSRPSKKYAPKKRGILYEIALGLSMVAIAFGLGVQILPRIVLDSIDNLASVVSSTLVDLTNSDRAAASVVKLRVNPLLENAAQAKVDDMVTKGYFSHNSPDGATPWHWFALAGYDFTSAGENLAIDFFDSVDIEKAWMNSPLHRANIVNSTFTEIGIATATGTYNGHQTTFVVQMFGRPIKEKELSIVQQRPIHTIASSTTFTAISR